MAGMIDKTKRRFLLTALKCSAAACPLMLGACVSTEELYAKYDEQACVFVVEKGPGKTLTLREQVSNLAYAWEPAVYFDYDDATLTDDSKNKLDTAFPILKQFPQLRLGLQGFTDRRGTYFYNIGLADRRVDAVLDYLKANGIDANRVSSQPIGKGLPEFGDDLELAHANNRRVELMLLDELGVPLHPRYSFATD
ncbi:MAG: OmpA family protein [Granulosicoccaceae bacterium]